MQVPHLEVDPTEGIPISSNAQGNESINLLYLIEADLSRSFLHIFQRALRVVESIGQRRLSFSQFIGHILSISASESISRALWNASSPWFVLCRCRHAIPKLNCVVALDGFVLASVPKKVAASV